MGKKNPQNYVLSETILIKKSSRVCLLNLGPFIAAPYKNIQ